MLDCGFKGCQIPAVPRACRSPRGRGVIRKKFEKTQKHDEYDILARLAEKFTGECENRISLDRLRQETAEEEETEATTDGFVVSNLLDTMEHDDVKSVSVAVNGCERNLPEMVSKDWLALGPSRSHHCCVSKVDYKKDRLNQKDGNFSISRKYRRASDSKMDFRVDYSSVGCKFDYFSVSRNWKRVSDSNIEHWIDDSRSNEADGQEQKAGNWKRLSKTNTDYGADDPSGVDKLERNKSGTWKRVSDSKIDGKRKQRCDKERNSCETNSRESDQSIYPFKKRKLLQQNNLIESQDSPTHQQSAPKDHLPSNLKFSIKAFKIPELFVDVPVSTTVGSLKSTVMEAVMQILKNGLDVGVLLQGKKIKDDSKTLIQTEIPRGDDKYNSLGFSLEPRKPDLTSSSTPETLLGVPGNKEDIAQELQVVPYRRKQIRRPETGQRRIRRPFTVTEVEALVQAVERLGTGRWRDVKSRAFAHVNHRTYVDLKDKWKTLVHTAKISPRQRRGEPVPQELLDRVLASHSFWSDRQTEFLRLKASS